MHGGCGWADLGATPNAEWDKKWDAVEKKIYNRDF
jgi:hypothetical protein